MFTVGAEAYIYRWLNATVGDEYGVPIPSASITAQFTGATEFEGQTALYYTEDGLSLWPCAEVLAYMGETESTYQVTKDDGKAVIPYLTDIIGDSTSTSSLYVGSYAITGSVVIATVPYSSTESFSFPAYPAMTDADQSFDFTVEVMDVVAESPDPSRWLVVTQGEVVIEDMTFYHGGDIIVAGTGTLIFRNAELLLIQSEAYERTVYVDGDARLIFEDSVVTSELLINIVTLGNGALEVYDSQLGGVNIVALEDSRVYLDGALMDGTITNAWDSHATLEVLDSELLVSPVLSGYATGSFTNTSLPSVLVQDDAVGYIYRWIHVTVFDGAGHTLPGALVSATGMFTLEHMDSSLTDDTTGVALLNSLASVITADDPDGDFVGLYTVNATYWYSGVPYESDYVVNISVLPYSTPLGSNATYTTLTISSTLPDLAIDLVGGVVADPASPKKGEETTITAFVRNDGVVGAYDVLVEFTHEVYGEEDMIDAVTVPVIGPGETAEVTAVWIAVPPLAYPHNISVEIDPLNTVPEYDETPATSYVIVIVQELADITIESTEITTEDVAVVDRLTALTATIRNYGDAVAENIWVAFYNGSISESNLIGTTVIDQLAPGGYSVASVDWVPTAAITHEIWVQANGTFDEITFDNNIAWKLISVLTPPDLVLRGMYFDPASDSVEGGSTILVLATLSNLQDAPFPYPTISVSIDEGTGPVEVDAIELTDVITKSSTAIVVQWTYSVPMVDETTEVEIYFEVNPDHSPEEQNYSNNVVHSTLTILDVREDFAVESAGLSVQLGSTAVTTEVFGTVVTFNANVSNLGARRAEAFSVVYGVLYAGNNWTIASITPALDGGASVTFSVDWTINITEPGAVVLWVALDVENAFVEQNESNNYAELEFTIGQMTLHFAMTINDTEFKAGETIVVEGYVRYDDSGGEFVRNLMGMSAELRDADGNAVAGTGLETSEIESDEDGYFAFYFTIPAELESGDYTVAMYHPDAMGESESDPVLITGVVAGGGIPLIVWIIVILAIVAVVAGFTIYTYVYGLGKLVECGECGAFIPAASKRCPKCGVEFEANTMKCSECGAWVPADSAECPNCGVKFVGEELGEDEGDYLERMRKEYDEMVSKYREVAKTELGKKFSDKKFEEWWRQQPSFITFDDWLAKEEEKRKEGPVPCPVCGTLNPKEATVCHKCGTVFGERREEPPSRGLPPIAPARQAEQAPSEEAPAETSQAQVAPAAAPRMVIRRPIDRKVVPKKIIKTPVGGTEERTENGGDETQ
jgi:ribosomal protein L40E